ncbi:MAG: hypothetical protein ABMB14_19445 [Myxococcota bacterium]
MLLLSWLSACKVVDAPEDLESLMVFGFVNFDDPDFLAATEEQLLPLIDANEADLTDDGYRVNSLTTEDLEAAGIDATNEGGIIGAMGLVTYTNTIDPVVETVSAEDKAAMWPDNFVQYEVLDQSDRPCFLDHGCDQLDQTVHETAKVALLGEAERTYDATYVRLESDDLPPAVFVRQISPEEMKFSSGLAVVHQQYSFVMMYQEEGHTARRIEAFWVDAEIIGLDVPDSYAVDQAVLQMSDQAERVDAWIDEH